MRNEKRAGVKQFRPKVDMSTVYVYELVEHGRRLATTLAGSEIEGEDDVRTPTNNCTSKNTIKAPGIGNRTHFNQVEIPFIAVASGSAAHSLIPENKKLAQSGPAPRIRTWWTLCIS